VLFDFGYTLFAHASLPATIAGCAARIGVAITDEQAAIVAERIDSAATAPEELLHRRDFDAAVWSQRWKALYSIADDVADGLGAAVYSSMHDPLEWVPYRNAASTLQALASGGVRVGVISNTGWDVRRVFEAHSMSTFVGTFTLSYEVGSVKPEPRIFAAACEALGLSHHDVLMVGDDPRSDGGAVATGLRTLLLPPAPQGSDNGLDSVLRLLASSSAKFR